MEESSISSTETDGVLEPSHSEKKLQWLEEIRKNIHVLRQILGLESAGGTELGQNLPHSNMKDILIVGLDLEHGSLQPHNSHSIKKKKKLEGFHFQIGLSILDTRQLHHRDPEKPLVHGHQFCTGSDEFVEEASRKFCFGQSEQITLSTVNIKILELIRGRDFVLVLFDGIADMQMLGKIGLDLKPLYIMDVMRLAQGPFPEFFFRPFRELLKILESPFEPHHLHCK
jgi:hypothetical protein